VAHGIEKRCVVLFSGQLRAQLDAFAYFPCQDLLTLTSLYREPWFHTAPEYFLVENFLSGFFTLKTQWSLFLRNVAVGVHCYTCCAAEAQIAVVAVAVGRTAGYDCADG